MNISKQMCAASIVTVLHLASCFDSKLFYMCRTSTFCMIRAFNFVVSPYFLVSYEEVKQTVAINTAFSTVQQ